MLCGQTDSYLRLLTFILSDSSSSSSSFCSSSGQDRPSTAQSGRSRAGTPRRPQDC